jgi:hypothetical protein
VGADTKIWTADGWKDADQIVPGDRVFQANGTMAAVAAVSTSHLPGFLVTLSDGSTLVTAAGQMWLVEPCSLGGGRFKTPRWMTTEAMMGPGLCDGTPVRFLGKSQSASNGRPNDPPPQPYKYLTIRNPMPIKGRALALPIEPYILGAWLGDGNKVAGQMFADPPDALGWMRPEFERLGYRTTSHSIARSFGVLGLKRDLRFAGVLGAKHVPGIYYQASTAQRLALLQGLMDTDGCAHTSMPGRCEFINTNLSIIFAVNFLARSLGFRVRIDSLAAGTNSGNPRTKELYKLRFVANANTLNPFRMPRKAARIASQIPQAPRVRMVVRKIEPVGLVSCCNITTTQADFNLLAGWDLVPTGAGG